MFQLTRPRGARPALLLLDLSLPDVSTHAPARGATQRRGRRGRRAARFNSRAREGRDKHRMAHRAESPWFQLTRPRGARLDTALVRIGLEQVSTHAPARGATGSPGVSPALRAVSTHAPARGATVSVDAAFRLFSVSTHAPARGATSRGWGRRARRGVSTHAPARGATSPGRRWSRPQDVSTHAPARGATWAACAG